MYCQEFFRIRPKPLKLRSQIVGHLLILYLTFSCLTSLAQKSDKFKIKEVGTPYITSYSSTEIGAHAQSTGIAQSKDGLLYISNVSGVIEFDGLNWDVDFSVSDDVFRGVAIGPDGYVYAATKGLIGYFEPDSVGRRSFHSLNDIITDQIGSWDNVWQVEASGNQVIFNCSSQLIIYNPEDQSVQSIKPKKRFGRSDVVGGRYYVIDYGRGLLELKDGELQLVPGSEPMRSRTTRRIVSYSKDELLLVTQKNGLFRLGNSRVEEWSIGISGFLKQQESFAAESIHDEYFAIGTIRGGMVIVDKTGRLIQKLNKAMGMGNDEYIHDIFLDKDNNLWVAQHGIISHILTNSAFTTIDERHGIPGYVLYLNHHKGKIYASTTTGTVVKDGNEPWHKIGEDKPFKPISTSKERDWISIRKDGDFFIAGNDGIVQVLDRGLKPLIRGKRFWAAVAMKNSPYLVIGSIEGELLLLSRESGEWKFKHEIKGFDQPMDFLEQTEDGNLWMTDSGSGVYKILLNAKKDSVLKIKTYNESHGLPSSDRNRVFRHKDRLYFATAAGIYQYNGDTDSFEAVPMFNEHIEKDYVFRFIGMPNDDFYLSLSPSGKGLLKYENGSYSLTRTPFQKIRNHNSEYVTGMGGNDIWVVGPGIKHYSWNFPMPTSTNFKAKIRSVEVSNKGDSLLFAGLGKQPEVRLSANENALNFSFSASFFDETETLQYQSYLEGSEEDWAPWSSKASRNYTNLSHGTYTFKVRASNLYGQLSEADAYTFVIITPWYLTTWAYILYGILVVVFIWGIVKINARRLEKEKAVLEQTVEERTTEIREQKNKAEKDKEIIQQQADRLKKLDKVKSRFFANISHELRTPLTLINAPLESLIENEEIQDEEVLHTLRTAQKNGEDLLSLVEEILDLGKLDAGKLRLTKNPTRLREFINEILKAYQTGAHRKEINWEIEFGSEQEFTLLMDENKCGKVVRNLLSNALKFTNNKIAIMVSRGKNGLIQIRVEDNGIGIHPNDLPYIFDRYYQSEQPESKAEGGTGIGLALAKELAQLHDGNLKVESQPGTGSKFIFEFRAEEVTQEAVVPLPKVYDDLEEVLKNTIKRYSEKFEVDRPVLLITEDHPEMRAFVAKTLAPYFEIRQAENGKVALDVLNTEQVDIIISDVMMPEMDGFELLEAIRKNENLHEVSVVMLTARADQEDKLYALTLGIDDYLTKPFSAAEFLARIKNILENRIKIIRELKGLVSPINGQSGGSNFKKLEEKYGLSEREIEVMQLLAKRYSNPEIAEKLFVSRNTIKYHIKNLFGKLDIKSRIEAAEKIDEILS